MHLSEESLLLALLKWNLLFQFDLEALCLISRTAAHTEKYKTRTKKKKVGEKLCTGT